MHPDEIHAYLSETLAGRYRPTAYLGEGYFCGAFRATDMHSGDDVAAKILKLGHCAASDAIQEFRDEVALLGQLTGCDRVVRLVDSGQHTIHLKHPATGGTIPVTTEFAVLELAAGSLTDLILRGSAFSWADRLRLYRDVVKGVHQMHLKGFVHRDAKADNALVFADPPAAKIADLGRARDARQPARFLAEAYFAGRGDRRFAPPEFLWGQGTEDPIEQALADVYLLGSLFFEVATGIGLTAAVIADPTAVSTAKLALASADRLADWAAHVPWLREQAHPAHDLFLREVPPVIGLRSLDLLRLLTDPEPRSRLPPPRGGVAVTPWNLEWLLKRVDGLRRAVDPMLRKAYLATRPNSRSSSRSRIRRS